MILMVKIYYFQQIKTMEYGNTKINVKEYIEINNKHDLKVQYFKERRSESKEGAKSQSNNIVCCIYYYCSCCYFYSTYIFIHNLKKK